MYIHFLSVDPDDYDQVTQSLTFGPNNKQVQVAIPIVDDNVNEAIEQFFGLLTLETTDANVEVNPSQATFEINDNDGR